MNSLRPFIPGIDETIGSSLLTLFASWAAVRYEAVNAMLLNEFLKEHRKWEQQQAIIGRLKISYFAAVVSPPPLD
jgi:hypothetical protein